jgi:hypothetical protein
MEDSNNYLNILLNDNEQLKNNLTVYLNTLVALKAIYSPQKEELPEQYRARLMQTVKPEERQALLNTIMTFRAYSTRLKINVNTIKDKVNNDLLTELNLDYEEIKLAPMPNYDSCERFVQNINNFLMVSLDIGIKFKKMD